jgi:uncharacterized membrane protein YhiD involved in acid resistance
MDLNQKGLGPITVILAVGLGALVLLQNRHEERGMRTNTIMMP